MECKKLEMLESINWNLKKLEKGDMINHRIFMSAMEVIEINKKFKNFRELLLNCNKPAN